MEKKFSDQHEWIQINGDVGIVGITEYAQHQLGDVVYTELPNIGKKVGKREEAAVVESVKAASEVYSPVTGEIIEINTSLSSNPDLINTSAEKDGWFFKIRLTNPEELSCLMDEKAYRTFVGA